MTFNENKEPTEWIVEIGFYPGLLFGYRVYEYEDSQLHVLYVPFMDISLEVFKK
jgi:hypothetical protein